MVENNLGDSLKALKIPNSIGPELGMKPDLFPFIFVRRGRFEKDVIADSQLAYVVQISRNFEEFDFLTAESKGNSDLFGNEADLN